MTNTVNEKNEKNKDNSNELKRRWMDCIINSLEAYGVL